MLQAQPDEKGIRVVFADGRAGHVPFPAVLKGLAAQGVKGVEIPTPFEIIVHTVAGESIELPWDFVRHHCDPSYAGRVKAISALGLRSIAERVRGARERAKMTQEALATAARISRVTLVRIENGEQSPRFETLAAISKALDEPIATLITQ